MSKERGEVVDRWPTWNSQLCQKPAILLLDDHPEVVRSTLHDRLRQRLEVSFPGIVVLGKPFEAGLDEGHPLAELEFVVHVQRRFSRPRNLPN